MAIMSHKLKFNDQFIKVEIVSTENAENFTRHTVRLLEPLEGLQVGETLSECYSFVKPQTAKMYGIKQDVFPHFEATREV